MRRTPLLRADLAWIGLGLALLLGWDALGLDLPLVRRFADLHGFAWHDAWFTSRVLHEGGRYVSIALFVLTCAACLRPFGPWRALARSERAWWFAITVVCLVTIPQIKHASSTSCPWDLQEFGGTARHVSHWLGLWPWHLSDGGPGRCFPSGHASGAFSFLAIGLVLRRAVPSVGRRWVIGLCGLGFVFGFAQMARGAHYASHTLYTAWLCASLTLVSWHALQAWHARAERAQRALAELHSGTMGSPR